MSQPWDEADLMRMVENTAGYTPAGDYFDMRPHLPVLYSIARWCTCSPLGEPLPLRPPRCLEIGVRQGTSTIAILMAMRRTNGRLISLDFDPVESAVTQQTVREQGLDQWWDFHLAHSDEFAITFTEELDFLWIDGEHEHPQPSRDFANYAPRVRQGGIIAMHDYWVDSPRPTALGVLYCVEEVRKSGQFEICSLPWAYGLTLMRRIV